MDPDNSVGEEALQQALAQRGNIDREFPIGDYDDHDADHQPIHDEPAPVMEGIDPAAVHFIEYSIERADRALIALRSNNVNIVAPQYVDYNRPLGGVVRIDFIRRLDG